MIDNINVDSNMVLLAVAMLLATTMATVLAMFVYKKIK
jgi:hypothetical protein